MKALKEFFDKEPQFAVFMSLALVALLEDCPGTAITFGAFALLTI